MSKNGAWSAIVASDRMAQVAADIAASANPTAAAAEFWKSVETTPLWEPDGEHAGAWRVTFLWRGAPELTRHVTLCGPMVLGETSAAGGLRFKQIAETDIWHLTLRLPPQTRASYAISPNGLLGPTEELSDFLRRQATWVHDPLNPSTFVIPANSDQPGW